MPLLVVTLVGPDRPGLVGAVSDAIRKNGGNWLESRMSHLADQFAGIVLTEVSDEQADRLVSSLKDLETLGLKVVIQPNTASGTSAAVGGELWVMNVVGNDRPGIIREVTRVLASRGVNVEELATECKEAPVSGGRIFKAEATVQLPHGLRLEQLQEELERIAADLMIDFKTNVSSG